MNLLAGFCIGSWQIYPQEGRVVAAGSSKRIQPKSMDVLVCLAAAEGAVVARDTLLQDVWDGRAMSDEPLTRCIGELRRALGDSRSDPQYIETIPKRGYRLLPPVRSIEAAVPVTEAEQVQPGSRKTLWAGIVAVLLIVAVGFVARLSSPGGDLTTHDFNPPEWSIAVLPFDDVSQDGSQSYMSDGIADEITRLLSRVRGLRLTSRSSAFALERQGLDIRTIASRLNVAYVLEGSVRTMDGRVRINASLVDTRTDTRVWSEDFDRELSDVFEIQDEIAASVASNLKLALSSGASPTLATDPAAYALFLRARQLHQQPAGDSYQKAFEFYEAALAIDPEYAPAWVWLAALYDDTANSSTWSAEEADQRARAAADRALMLAPEDPLALGISGLLRLSQDNDLIGAAREMQNALEIEPNNPIVMRWAVNLLIALARFDDAVVVGETLFEQDPLGRISRINLALTYVMAGRYEPAISLCQGVLDESVSGGPCLSALVLAYAYSGQSDAAASALAQADSPRIVARLAPRVYHAAGDEARFNEAIQTLKQGYEDGDRGLATALARSYAFSGDHAAALDWLETAATNGATLIAPGLSYYRMIESEPRYQQLLMNSGTTSEALNAVVFEIQPSGLGAR